MGDAAGQAAEGFHLLCVYQLLLLLEERLFRQPFLGDVHEVVDRPGHLACGVEHRAVDADQVPLISVGRPQRLLMG